jgi:Ca2+-binding RTX toxin-like protein
MATLNGTAGADTLTGGAANDLFNFTPAQLGAADILTGGGGTDTLQFTAGGSIGAGVQVGIAGIERIGLAAAGNVLTVRASVVASAGGRLEVAGGAGNDRVDGSGLADPTLRLFFGSGGGNDTFLGGAGADTISMGLGGLNAADSLGGGAGTDRLLFNNAGTVLAAAMAGLASIEEIALSSLGGSTLQVTDAVTAQAGGVLTVIGGTASDRVDAALVTAAGAVHFVAGGGDTFDGGAGADTLSTGASLSGALGAGDDVLLLTGTAGGGSTVAGGDGLDAIVIGAAGNYLLGAGLTGFETVEIAAAGVQVTLAPIAELEAFGSEFDDRVVLGGARQSVFGFDGNDVVVATAARLPGALLQGGDQTTRDTLQLSGGGNFDLRRVFVSGFERVEALASTSSVSVWLPAQAIEAVLRSAGSLTLGANAAQTALGSPYADTITLGAAGQMVMARGGADTIVGTAEQLVAGTMIDGGGGTQDTLRITSGGSVDLATGALVQNVERIVLGSNTSLVLDATPAMQVVGSSGADTIRAVTGDLTGDLGSGSDLLEIDNNDLSAAAGTFSFGSGFSQYSGNDIDTLRVLQASFVSSILIPTRFTNYERLDLRSLNNVGGITIQDVADREILMTDAFQSGVTGGGGNETFQVGNGFVGARGGAGNDTMNGGTGPSYLRGESGNDSLSGAGGEDSLDGGVGADTLRGGAGDDLFFIDGTADLADWGGPSRTVVGAESGQGAGEVDTLVIVNAAAGATLNLGAHQISEVDRIEIGTAGLTLILSDAMAATAQAETAPLGTIEIGAYGFTSGAHVIVGSALGATRRLWVDGELGGADSILGGAGGDRLDGGSGNDTVKGADGGDAILGGGGQDELRGEAGADSIVGGAGLDSIWGDDGADTLDGGAADAASDRFAYNSNTNGSADIDGAQGASFGADLILDFVARSGPADTAGDWIALSRTGLGLAPSVTVKKLAEGEGWNATSHAVFILHQNDNLDGTQFADFAQIAAAVNGDAGTKSGWVAGRTVVFALSNDQAAPNQRVGLYWWQDDGDAALEVADNLRLLALVDGQTTQGFTVDTVVIA